MAFNFKKVISINREENEKCYKCGEKATHEVVKEGENILTCTKQECMIEAMRK